MDFDVDGDVDLLVGGMIQSQHRGLRGMLNGGTGASWRAMVIQTEGSYSAELGDVGNNGDLDIVGIRNWNSSPTWICQSNTRTGRGGFTERRVGAGPESHLGGRCPPCLLRLNKQDTAAAATVDQTPYTDALGTMTAPASGLTEYYETTLLPDGAGAAVAEIDRLQADGIVGGGDETEPPRPRPLPLEVIASTSPAPDQQDPHRQGLSISTPKLPGGAAILTPFPPPVGFGSRHRAQAVVPPPQP